MLEHAYWDGVESDSVFSRFHVQDAPEGKLIVMDLVEELQFSLPRSDLMDPKFDPVGWFDVELDNCKNLTELIEGDTDSLTHSDIPPLEDVSDSDSLGRVDSRTDKAPREGQGKRKPRR
jgi:hypothetical protein